MTALSFIAMYILMYAMVDGLRTDDTALPDTFARFSGSPDVDRRTCRRLAEVSSAALQSLLSDGPTAWWGRRVLCVE